MQYYTVQEATLTLEPRSSCGFFLYEYTAFLDIRHQYPISLYHRDYKQVQYSDVEYIVKFGDDDGDTPGADCFTDLCHNYIYVEYGKHYFHLVNWDYDEPKSVDVIVFDLGSKYF